MRRKELDSFVSRMADMLAPLDVIHVEATFATSHDATEFTLELRDKRRMKITLDGRLLRAEPELRHAFLHETHGLLTQAFRRCMDHEDCRQLKELGEACWQETYGHG